MITNVITLKQYANKHGLDVKRLRRVARKHEWPNDNGPFKFGGANGIWAIDATAPAIVLPDKSRRGQRRPDGRQRYIVYANAIERDAVANVVTADNIIDPRIARKLAAELTRMVDDEINDNVPHPDDVARATELNIIELNAIERGIDTLSTDARENDDNG